MATAIGDLVAKLRMDTRGFAGPLKTAGLQSRQFAASLKTVAIGAGIAGAAALAASVKLVRTVQAEMKVMDDIGKHAQRLNIATEALVGLQHQAELTGAGASVLDKSMRKMMQSIGELTAFGTGEADYAFKALQLDPGSLIGKSPEQQYGAIADALLSVEDQTTRVAIATKIFGRSGADMLVMLQEGSAGMKAAAKDAEYLGLTFSAIDSQKIEMANDEWYRMKSAFTGLIRELAVRFAPIMGTLANTVAEFFVEWRKGIEQAPSATSGWIQALKGVGSVFSQILISYHEIEAMDVRMKIAQKRAFGAPTSEINELSKEYGGHLRRIRELEQIDWGSRVEDTFNRISTAVRDSTRYMGTFQDDLEEVAERFKPANDAAELFNKWLRETIQFNMTDREKQIDDLLAAGAPTGLIDALRTADRALNVRELNKQFQDPFSRFIEQASRIDAASAGLAAGVRERAIQSAYDEFMGADKGFGQTQTARYSGAMTRGSAEAYSTILNAGKESDKTAKAHLQVGKMTLEQLRQINSKTTPEQTVSIPSA